MCDRTAINFGLSTIFSFFFFGNLSGQSLVLQVSGSAAVQRSQFALLLLQRSVQPGDELEEAPAEAFLFGLPLQRAEPPLLLPRGGRLRLRPPHVAASAGAAGQLRLGGGEELAGRPQALLLPLRRLLLFVLVCGAGRVRRVQAGLVERVVLGGRAEEAGAAAGAAGAAQGPLSGGAGSAEAAVHPRRLQGLVDRSVAEHYAFGREGHGEDGGHVFYRHAGKYSNS